MIDFEMIPLLICLLTGAAVDGVAGRVVAKAVAAAEVPAGVEATTW
jgi:hypothetical protein